MAHFSRSFLPALLLAIAACELRDPQQLHVDSVIAAGGTVDSVIPLEERLRRFRATTLDRPDTLRHASRTIEALAHAWLEAIGRSDTVALNRMILDRSEFAWLFYPSSSLSRPPYEMPPALLWEQMLANSDDGARKTLQQLAGRRIELRSIRCPAPPDTEALNVIRQGCLLRLRAGNDTLPEARFFGSILEREGRFKLLGLSNKL